MSNKETLQGYNETLNQYNTNLDDILNTINNLPENENLTEELNVYNNEVTEQEATINTILKTLQTKAIGGGGSMNNYSTEETLIGSWLGKPLYRKVVVIDMEPNEEKTISTSDLGLSDADMIMVNFGTSVALYYHGVGSPKYGFSPILYYASSTDKTQIYINADRNLIMRNHNQNPRKNYIVFEYTKTTD